MQCNLNEIVIVNINGKTEVFDTIDTAWAYYNLDLFGKDFNEIKMSKSDCIIDNNNYIKFQKIIYHNNDTVYSNKIPTTMMEYIGQTTDNSTRANNLYQPSKYSGMYFEADRLRYNDEIVREVIFSYNDSNPDRLNYMEAYCILKRQTLFPYGYNDKIIDSYQSLLAAPSDLLVECSELSDCFIERINRDEINNHLTKEMAKRKLIDFKNFLNCNCQNISIRLKDETVPDKRESVDYGEFGNLTSFCMWIKQNRPKNYVLNGNLLRLNDEKLSPSTCCFLPKSLAPYLKNIHKFNFELKDINYAGMIDTCIYKANKYADKKYRVSVGGFGKYKTEEYFETLDDAIRFRSITYVNILKDLAENYKNDISEIVYNTLINFDVEKLEKLAKITPIEITYSQIEDALK